MMFKHEMMLVALVAEPIGLAYATNTLQWSVK